MNKQMFFSYIIFIFSVFISSVSQVILKKSSNIKYSNRIREYLNMYVITAYFIFFMSSLITVYAYKNVPLSVGPAIEASGYLFVSLMDWFILKEKISKRKILGIFIIVFGIMIMCFGG